MKIHPHTKKSYVRSVMPFVIMTLVMSLMTGGAHGASNEPRLKNIKKLTVIDAHHKTVGQIGPFPACAGSAVAYQVGDRKFFVGVDKTGFSKCLFEIFVFESSDCSGTPFVQVITTFTLSALIETARVDEPGSTVYLPDLDNIQQGFQSHSTQSSSGCFAFDQTLNVAPEIPIIDLDTVFTPPFEVR
ncbi:MAG: hypothetical protein ACXW1Z_25915 [Methylobacter sp.]